VVLIAMVFTLLGLVACLAVTRWAAQWLGVDPVETARWFGILEVEAERVSRVFERPADEPPRRVSAAGTSIEATRRVRERGVRPGPRDPARPRGAGRGGPLARGHR
jgi:hypothetical protein